MIDLEVIGEIIFVLAYSTFLSYVFYLFGKIDGRREEKFNRFKRLTEDEYR